MTVLTRRQLISISVVGGILLSFVAIASKHGASPIGTLVIIGSIAAISWQWVKRLVALWPAVRYRAIYCLARAARGGRKVYRSTPEAEFLALASMLAGVLGSIILMVTQSRESFFYAMEIVVGLVIFGGAIECVQRTMKITRMAWGRVLGKFVLVSIGAVVVYIAKAGAQHVAFEITKADSSHFSNFVGLLAVVTTPVLYALFLAFVAAIWAWLDLALFAAAWVAHQIFEVIAKCLGRSDGYAYFVHRVIEGKRPANKARLELHRLGLTFLWRSLSLAAFCTGVISVGQAIIGTHTSFVDRGLRLSLVALDYQPGRGCEPGDTRLGVVIDAYHISIATISKEGVTFATERCEST